MFPRLNAVTAAEVKRASRTRPPPDDTAVWGQRQRVGICLRTKQLTVGECVASRAL